MKLLPICIFLIQFSFPLFAQDLPILFKEAQNLESSFDEPGALEKYRQITITDPLNIKALVKATELSCRIGNRQTDKKEKRLQYESALSFATRAVKSDTNNADAHYALALASGKMTEVETDNKKLVGYVKQAQSEAEKSITINPKHAKSLFVLGKWNLEMVNLNGFKQTAVKLFYGGTKAYSLENAIDYFEKSRAIDPYCVMCHYELAKAYQQDVKVAKQIEILERLIKLPIRILDDKLMKEEAKKQLDEIN